MKRVPGSVAVSALMLASACGGAPFAESDPDGYAACRHLAESETSSDGLLHVVAAGEAARRSSTKAIREVGGNVAGEGLKTPDGKDASIFFPDVDDLKAACQDEGFEF